MQEISLQLYKKEVLVSKKTKYAGKIGSIIYAMIETCTDITFVTSMVSHFLKI